MKRQGVSSSNIISIGYDSNSSTLEVEFKGGHVYEYYNVPALEYNALMNAPSHGKYLNANIKDNYKFSEL